MRGLLAAFGAAAWLFMSGAGYARPLVAVIDSGVAQTPELRPLLVAEYDMAGSRTAFSPRYDHGTMIATIIARESKGAIGLVSLRIDDPAGCPAGLTPPCQSGTAPIVAAIRKATALGVDAINISLSLKDDPAIGAAIHEAAARGILIVLAAGNEGHDHPGNLGMALAGYPNSVLVGALDAQGNPWAGSNRPDVERHYDYVWRRGVDVPATLIDGSAATGTGTSFAAPIETARRVMAREAARATTAAKLTTASAS